MPVYVSVSPELEVVIRSDIPGRFLNQYGLSQDTVVRPALYARFQPKRLSFSERTRADLAFKAISPDHPYGATPIQEGGIMSSFFAEEMIDEHNPEPIARYNPVHMLGRFDTATDIDYTGQLCDETPTEADVRALVESKLNADTSLNRPQGFILLDGVTAKKPWPNYPTEGQGRHMKIAAKVKEDGYSPAEIIAFEETLDKPGEGVINAMKSLLEEQESQAVEDESLSAVIPR